MPYEARADGGDKWVVVNKSTGEVKFTHEPPDAKGKAERQVRLLTAVENDPQWEPTHE